MKKLLIILLCLPFIGFGQIFYFDEEDSAAFYNLDILNNQFNYISTFPFSDGGYGSQSTFDPINNIFYIANEIEISGKNLLVISFFIGFLSTTKTISQIKKY